MTVSPWLTFEKLKELDSVTAANLYLTDSISINAEGGSTNVISTASGIAIGPFLCQATGTSSIAIGLAIASAFNSLAIGAGAFAQAGFSTCIGEDSSCGVSADNAVAIGSNTDADGEDSLAAGNQAQATALRSSALGAFSNATAADSIQLGSGTNNTAETMQYLSTPIANSSGLIIPGPFADDTAAAGGGVGIGNPYYTATGAMQVRLT